MTNLLELSESLGHVHDVNSFWDRIGLELEEFGVTSFLYGAASSRREILDRGYHPASFIKTNYPDEYFEAVGVENFLDNDISAQHIIYETAPMFWHEEPDWDYATPEQKHDWFLSEDFGMQVGVTVATTVFDVNHQGGIGLCMGELSTTEFEKMWADKQGTIMQILGLLDIGMRGKHLQQIIGLSPREREVLTWLANGYRPDQIAYRLNIGYRTVDKYINSAKRKLNARTRDQAVAKALIFKAIEP